MATKLSKMEEEKKVVAMDALIGTVQSYLAK